MAGYYATKEWKELAQSVLDRDEHTCQRCGATKSLLVHHKVPRKNGGADHKSNLKTVCKSCHIKEHVDYARSFHQKYEPTDEELSAMGLL